MRVFEFITWNGGLIKNIQLCFPRPHLARGAQAVAVSFDGGDAALVLPRGTSDARTSSAVLTGGAAVSGTVDVRVSCSDSTISTAGMIAKSVCLTRSTNIVVGEAEVIVKETQTIQRRQSSQLGGNRTGEGIVAEIPAEERA